MSKNKNIMILFLSKVYNSAQSFKYKYESQPDIPEIIGIQTNEAAVKAVLHQLNKKNESLSEIYMLCTDTVNNEPINEKETHKTFFIRRITEYCEINNFSIPTFKDIKYDEKSKGDAVFAPIIKMAEEIKSSPKNTYVYADMTGGMRNSSMLMLSIMRLLEYNGIKVKKVFYSNWDKDTAIKIENISNYISLNGCSPKIEKVDAKKKEPNIIDDVTNIYQLNTLIAGAEEFNKFGSADTLSKYLKNKNCCSSDSLNNLIDSMNNFSEYIKLCRAGNFDNAIKDLSEKKDTFKIKYNSNFTNDRLFYYLILPIIEKKYIKLFTIKDKPKKEQHLEIIKWCIDNDFLQQALTLFVEWIPDYIVQSKILYYVDSDLERTIKDLKSGKLFDKADNTYKKYYKYIGYEENYIFINAKELREKGIKGEKIRYYKINEFIENGLISKKFMSLCELDTVKDIINKYHNIKTERHNINHANNGENHKTSEQITIELNKYIELLETNSKNFK